MCMQTAKVARYLMCIYIYLHMYTYEYVHALCMHTQMHTHAHMMIEVIRHLSYSCLKYTRSVYIFALRVHIRTSYTDAYVVKKSFAIWSVLIYVFTNLWMSIDTRYMYAHVWIHIRR